MSTSSASFSNKMLYFNILGSTTLYSRKHIIDFKKVITFPSDNFISEDYFKQQSSIYVAKIWAAAFELKPNE